MKSFFKYTFASIVGVLVASLILFFIFLGIIGSIISSTEKEVIIKPNSILHIKLDKPIPERSSSNPIENFDFVNFKPTTAIGLKDIIYNIRKAKTDPNIKGIYLDLSLIMSGWGSIEEIRNALFDFKKSKKFIVSYADYYTHGSYYLASVSDSVFINPLGLMMFVGLRSEQMFIKGTLEKLDIEPEIIRHGKFKSAVEPLMNDRMSDENRQQVDALLSATWNHVLTSISKARKIDIKRLNQLADELAINNAESIVEYKLMDGIRYKDEILSTLTKLSGVASVKKLELVEISKYAKAAKPKKNIAKDKIALVYASGEINMDSGDGENISAENLSKTIREARQDSSIKAIVLRINSPGGSALASEIIWREVDLAAKAKPLIVSMGAVAASGGYYIATPAKTILADSTTITGSIGVFGVLFNVQGFFKNKLGITTDVAQTNKHSSLGSPFRPLSAEERAFVQAQVENTYSSFISHVAKGRSIPKARVDSIGQGRVWNAQDALKFGLVDMIGGVEKAIEIAANNAKLKEYSLIELPKPESPLNILLDELSAKIRNNIVKSELGNEAAIYSAIKKTTNMQGVQMRIPYEISIY